MAGDCERKQQLVERVVGGADPDDRDQAAAILGEICAGRFRVDGRVVETKAGGMTIDLVAHMALAYLDQRGS